MNAEIWFALAAANFAASVAPGQNVALVGSATARTGLVGGTAALLGILVAELIWSVLALTLAVTAREVSPILFTCLKAASGGFLFWLGMSLLREGPSAASDAAAPAGCFARFTLDGFWIGLANPLALIFFLSLFPGLVSDLGDTTDPMVLACCVSAILLSSAAGLAPWLVSSGALAKIGFARHLHVLSGGALLVMGVLVTFRLIS
ncbi:LysE family transporter [Hoeflea sp. WL0058]|uniref:LysE family transporter n=1 Tax=Flavimaribacter sediminis TaxID=2865987 RepID=A0AAE2ZUW4_9HYPH|nr:LysE family transporter [Flavimaribacter sediminis]MBW8640097.1 LysE family transporter [Flavimaribacter sediminis]